MADDAARYHRLQLVLGAVSLAVSVAYLVALVLGGAGHAAVRAAARLSGAWWWQVAAVAALLGTGRAVLGFPLAWVRGYWLPKRFGLLHQPPGAWLADRLKAAALGAALGLVSIEVVYGLLRLTPLWWLAAAAVFFVMYAAIAAVLPVWVVPLFYRMTPLADDDLRRRLLALAERTGVPAVGVWVVDQSRKSRTANAAVVGLGRTRRIILFDTLTARFSPEEIESVLAHELGHHVHGDIRRGLVVQGVTTLVSFAVADVVLRAGVPALGLAGPDDPAGLPWLALVLLGLGLVAVPLANAFSRLVERQADDFALAVTRNAGAFIAALERLGQLNLAKRRPHRLEELFLYSHPSLERRIARAARYREGREPA
jgi:STE24 endopeptidase